MKTEAIHGLNLPKATESTEYGGIRTSGPILLVHYHGLRSRGSEKLRAFSGGSGNGIPNHDSQSSPVFSHPHQVLSETSSLSAFWISKIYIFIYLLQSIGFPGGSVVKNLPANAGDSGDMGLILGLGRSPRVRKWQPTLIFLPGEIPWTEERGRLQSMGLQRVRQD